ncbi:hypothetical protein [Catenuloplanes atrovinosus]|uniref:Uncharacterized protein n=1 Tax=Catenuloplanes atrovinosus TaxID=137266 RepID=A0AAE4C8Z6_9ACTN|nr:hypothetical protein [Catenuloplanes atrovinosus]MDR7275172.1 hypothetical protein [Catenuloplanes atrovinosus]
MTTIRHLHRPATALLAIAAIVASAPVPAAAATGAGPVAVRASADTKWAVQPSTERGRLTATVSVVPSTPDTPLGPVTPGTSLWAPPWVLIGLLAVLPGRLAYRLIRVFRARRGAVGPPAPAGGTAAAA